MPVRRLSDRRRLGAAALAAAVTLTGCSSGGPHMPGMARPAPPVRRMPSAMPGMDHAAARGDGTAATAAGYTLNLARQTATSLEFRISASGRPVTAFAPDQTKLMHVYLVRSDLTGFQHVHPRMAADGTWTAPLAALTPGDYRVYAAFIPAAGTAMGTSVVLGAPLAVAGTPVPRALPPAATSTTVDGYRVTVSGRVTAGTESSLRATFSKDGTPVTDLRPYLDTYAHLTAIHAGDLAFAHLHPGGAVAGGHGGPTLDFTAMLPAAGDWRLFLQFQTAGRLHTAALTLTVS
jgi:hypothetical protein